MTVEQAAVIIQTVVAVAAVTGVLVSLWSGYKTSKEVQLDRKAREAPLILFERGSRDLPVFFRRFEHRILGINPDAVERVFSDTSTDANVVEFDIASFGGCYGRLLNVGFGPALEVEVQWRPELIKIGSEEFTIDSRKLSEPAYSEDANTMPAVPGIVGADKESGLSRMPTFIVLDFDRKVNYASGRIIIRCTDVAGRPYRLVQDFRVFTNYASEHPTVGITFGDILEPSTLVS